MWVPPRDATPTSDRWRHLPKRTVGQRKGGRKKERKKKEGSRGVEEREVCEKKKGEKRVKIRHDGQGYVLKLKAPLLA